MRIQSKILAILIVMVIAGLISDTFGQKDRLTDLSIDVPIKVPLCEVGKDRAAYNHKLIEITGFVSRGFENSMIFDPSCAEASGVWVEIGGKTKTGTIYCCGPTSERVRSEELVVEGIPIPLESDEQFKMFDKLMSSEDSVVRATLVGRFFSGEKSPMPNGTMVWTGYGHFGLFSLFVIQKIVSFDAHRPGFNRRESGFVPNTDEFGCESYNVLEQAAGREIIDLQNAVDEKEKDSWRRNDPKRVATEWFESLETDKQETDKQFESIKLTQHTRSEGSITYIWKPKGKGKRRYAVEVSRPYWLSFYAKDPQQTIWIVNGGFKICT